MLEPLLFLSLTGKAKVSQRQAEIRTGSSATDLAGPGELSCSIRTTGECTVKEKNETGGEQDYSSSLEKIFTVDVGKKAGKGKSPG